MRSAWGEEEQALSSLPGLKLLGEAAALQLVSGRVMQFEVCIKIKVLQVGRKSMGKRRDSPVGVTSSPGGSKGSNWWCQCMCPG